MGRRIFGRSDYPDGGEGTRRLMARVLEEPRKSHALELRTGHKDGTFLWMEVTGINLLDEPGVGAIIWNYRDVTERKHLEQEVTSAKEQLEVILQNVADAITVVDANDRLDGAFLANLKYTYPWPTGPDEMKAQTRGRGTAMETPAQTALVLAAQAGDQKAFEALVGAYQRELLVHCYRMLGSFHDAEDLVQETLLRAWEKRTTLTSPGAYRGWLYRIATNLCLDRLRSAPRRSLPPDTHPMSDPNGPVPQRVREPVWLEPFPDDLLADQRSDPQGRAESREQTSLAFLIALQYLTPAQRAVLLLREVLSWEASEVAEWLNLSVPAVNSALQRARHAMQQRNVGKEAATTHAGPHVLALLDRYVALWEQNDIPGFVALLREDAWFTMPPFPAWFQGRAALATLFQTPLFTAAGPRRLLPTRANGSPAFAFYLQEAATGVYQLAGLMVLGVVDEQIAHIVAFLEPESFSSFALPPTFP